MDRTRNQSAENVGYAVLGLGIFFALWQWAGKTGMAGPALPPLSDVINTLRDSEILALLARSAKYTLASAAKGLLFGGSLAVLLAVVMHLLPPLRPGLDRLAVLVNAAPPIAIGPILIVVFSRSQTPAALAGIQVFFIFYVAASSGLAAASPALRLVMAGFGANAWKQMVHLELPAALPQLASGLKAAVSASFLGAILGEWFGAPQGLGLTILSAMQNFQIPLMWAAVTFAAAMSLTAFLAAAALEKIRVAQVRHMKRFLSQTWAVILLLAGWSFWVQHSGLNGIVIVTPLAVVRELIHNPLQYVEPALHTLAVALFGIFAGLLCGLLLAIFTWTSKVFAGLSIPLALLLTSVPVVCLIPILSRIFGYDDRTVFVTVIILCFLPGFVFASAGLKALPSMAEEYFFVQGAGRWDRLWRLALPAAMPNLALALRVLAVQSVLSALIAEFLMQTGGLGSLIATSTADLAMDQALAASLVSVAIALVLYAAASSVQRAVLKHYQ